VNRSMVSACAAVDDRRFQVRALAAMYFAGAFLGVVTAVVPHGQGVHVAAWVANSSLGFPVGGALLLAGHRVPGWALHPLLVVGAAIVTLAIVFGGGGETGIATTFFLVWIALYVGWFFTRRVAAAHLAAAGTILAVILVLEGVDGTPAIWLLVMGTAVVASGVVGLMRDELVRAATRDFLTRLPTRSTLDDALARETARAERQGSPLCVAMIDVDGLKSVNDRHGHPAGDRILAGCASGWGTALRDTDLLVRFGGDEFAVVLPDCPLAEARAVLERVLAAGPIPASAGLAQWEPGDTAARLLERADADLYETKRAKGVAGAAHADRSPPPSTRTPA
jgi:diguanylate cyclase (GGDEF)-like protein